MRRKSVLVRSLIALAAATALPGAAAAVELPQPVIQQPTLPQLPDVQKDIQQLEHDAYDALPKELQNSPVFAGSSRPAAKPAPTGKQQSQSVADATCSNCVAITYDDGPGELTAQLLDTLKAKDAHASFMVLAPSATAHPDLLRRMKAEGHTVGNHTASHRELNKLSPSDVDGEIKAGAAAIKAATGENPRWMRPPYGATNGTVDAAAKANGQAQALWSVDTVDWKDRNSEHVCEAAVSGAQPGSIVLMHDIHATTVGAADCVIDGLRAKGLEPVSLDRLIPNPEPGRQYFRR
ncbi:peptidoglycan N-acetylglucosamine deacetylase [Corynebacterium sp. HMSC062E11]|uniref:polysaccharide deacetylase family protein n=1 Tax=unclassified Corynebacterium TaxID=2624378 RepID=UPI0008A4731D|nr:MULTISPECIES: polysaccharide deacetylase family protein [unclassified Corynebacterium]MDK6808453.1 polysaccharide deacetylase family protein [Corynebacterium aurimucosum]NJJ84376.1 polysaccharide deacetylase family protein [Corynebacterium aurimucosum]OFK26396.1 peptidoglycan N-acetylglucosamine deacetylase [Corynebacterium sp. HMSC062E11]OFP72744.1 peptidoglycan N-acetylglucosamine deacetylase [Corynebacterium sp. HMSC078C09]